MPDEFKMVLFVTLVVLITLALTFLFVLGITAAYSVRSAMHESDLAMKYSDYVRKKTKKGQWAKDYDDWLKDRLGMEKSNEPSTKI